MNPPTFAFPLKTVTVQIGELCLRIRCLQSRELFYASTSTDQSDLYAYILWESALALGEWLVAGESVAGQSVLELGAGVGVPGLVAQRLGATVTQTDYQMDSLLLCEWNAHENEVKTELLQANWRRWTHNQRYDLILAADILYDTSLHYYVERIFHRNLARGGRILLADPGRPQALDFAIHLEEHGWQVAVHTHPVIPHLSGDPNPLSPSQDGAVAVTIYEVWR